MTTQMTDERKEYFGIARKIVSNMTTESWREIPHVVVVYEADVTGLLEEYRKIRERGDLPVRITINTLLLKLVCEGLKRAPKMNATLEFKRRLVRGCLTTHERIHISMPMVLPNGEMMTVNVRDMGDKTLTQMTETINDITRRMRNTDLREAMFETAMDNTIKGLKKGRILQTVARLVGAKTGRHRVKTLRGKARKAYYAIPPTERLTKHDIEQGTITVSNQGSLYPGHRGMCALLEIIPPQVAAIALASAQKRPVVVTNEKGEDSIAIRTIVPVTIAFDHRALDYGDVTPFMRRLDELLAEPSVAASWV